MVPSLGDRIEVCLGCGGESYVILASGIGPDSGPMNELRDENIEVESSLLGSICCIRKLSPTSQCGRHFCSKLKKV